MPFQSAKSTEQNMPEGTARYAVNHPVQLLMPAEADSASNIKSGKLGIQESGVPFTLPPPQGYLPHPFVNQ